MKYPATLVKFVFQENTPLTIAAAHVGNVARLDTETKTVLTPQRKMREADPTTEAISLTRTVIPNPATSQRGGSHPPTPMTRRTRKSHPTIREPTQKILGISFR